MITVHRVVGCLTFLVVWLSLLGNIIHNQFLSKQRQFRPRFSFKFQSHTYILCCPQLPLSFSLIPILQCELQILLAVSYQCMCLENITCSLIPKCIEKAKDHIALVYSSRYSHIPRHCQPRLHIYLQGAARNLAYFMQCKIVNGQAKQTS